MLNSNVVSQIPQRPAVQPRISQIKSLTSTQTELSGVSASTAKVLIIPKPQKLANLFANQLCRNLCSRNFEAFAQKPEYGIKLPLHFLITCSYNVIYNDKAQLLYLGDLSWRLASLTSDRIWFDTLDATSIRSTTKQLFYTACHLGVVPLHITLLNVGGNEALTLSKHTTYADCVAHALDTFCATLRKKVTH